MKEHFQDFGGRKWAGDDLIELQAEPLAALQTLVAPYAPCILQGCEMETVSDGSGGTTYRLHAGLAALKGVDAAGNPCVKIVRVEEEPWKSNTVYLSLKCEQKSRTYADGNNKVIANEYKAALSATQSDGALKISATAGAPRLVDTLGITQKLNTVGGNAKDVVVTFTETIAEMDSVPDRPELKSGSSLGLLLRQIRKWFDELKDLKALAFKAKVAKGDLDADLKEELDGKVEQEGNKVLSECDFTKILKDKLDGIPKDANNFTYTHPALNHIPSGGSSGQYLKYYSSGTAQWVSPANNAATSSASGFMSASDKIKLDGIASGANYFTYTHPTGNGNNHIPSGGSSGQYLKWSASGTATWAKPSASEIGAASSSHTHTPSSIGAASTDVATPTAAGLMPASDKAKLDGINNSIKIAVIGSTIRISWMNPNTAPNPTACYADIRAM